MSYDSDYSDNCDDDSCPYNNVHSVDTYETTPSAHYSYDGAPQENYCPCQPVEINIFIPENIYMEHHLTKIKTLKS